MMSLRKLLSSRRPLLLPLLGLRTLARELRRWLEPEHVRSFLFALASAAEVVLSTAGSASVLLQAS